MWLSTPNHKAVVGHFGSGKTEISISAALYLASKGVKTCIADLDIVNPFFRTAEKKELLTSGGVDVIYPQFALSAVDVPVLGPEMMRAFTNPGTSILDVGGDETGAAALGCYFEQTKATNTEMYFVINPYRPRSNTAKLIIELMDKVVLRSRMEITGIIANANLGNLTTNDTLKEGRPLIEEVSKITGLPVVAECGTVEALSGGTLWEPFTIKRSLASDWLEELI